jgi:hypothetical protein
MRLDKKEAQNVRINSTRFENSKASRFQATTHWSRRLPEKSGLLSTAPLLEYRNTALPSFASESDVVGKPLDPATAVTGVTTDFIE